MNEAIKCEHCGELVADEYELEIFHRGCRLEATFPGTATKLSNGIVSFDMNKIKEQLKRDVAVKSRNCEHQRAKSKAR